MKVRLQAQRDSYLATGIYAASNHSTTYSEVTVTTSGVDLTTALAVGNRLYRGDGEEYGKITSIDSATQFKFFMLYYIPIVSGDQFYVPALDTYELDLQKEPNISINYQFDDVKDPSKTKGSFSQTFKLPFTPKNNKFFQDWYNVNLDTLVFSTKEEYDASIYVGTVSQFNGVLQLRSLYQKAQYYVVTIFSKTSSLFSLIGDESLRNAFLSEDGTTWNQSLNHFFTATQMKNSWEGSSSAFVNSNSVSLKDPDHNIQKVMYPISVTQADFYFNDYNENYLNRDQAKIDSTPSNSYITDIVQFRPAIQVKEMIKIILGKIGLSYTSTFIDSEYFSKIFMTTGGHLEDSPVPIIEDTVVESTPGVCIVGYGKNSSWGIMGTESNPMTEEEELQYDDPAENYSIYYPLNPDTTISDDDDCYNETYNYFTKKHLTQNILTIKHRISHRRIKQKMADGTDSNNPCGWTFTIRLYKVDADGQLSTSFLFGNNILVADVYSTIMGDFSNCGNNFQYEDYVHNIDISDVDINTRFRIVTEVSEFFIDIDTTPNPDRAGMALGLDCAADCDDCIQGSSCALSTEITMNWNGYNLEEYGAVRNIPACIDPELKQKDFFKDLIQRFNLIVTANPNNPSNIVIETYDTYLGSGTTRYWTDKLDLSKEVIVKDTSSLQKERIYFTDKEDEDLYNKEIKERHPDYNVYGYKEITETNNKWAKGELKNNPMFSPYINGWTLKGSSSQDSFQTEDLSGTDLHNMAVHYEISYEVDEDENEINLKNVKTNPKLFWYNGTPTDIRNNTGEARTIYMHSREPSITAHSFTKYPLCSPYELTPNATTDESELKATTKSLYWASWATPFVPECKVFKWTESTPENSAYTLYGYYWQNYLVSLHHPESRLMEAYINLNAVDIFNFEFNDEIFIKDSYWRILKIHNYQVGVKTSTKVTLIKVVDTLIGTDCGFVNVGIANDTWIKWCPFEDQDCSVPILWVPPNCCSSMGGSPDTSYINTALALGYTNGELPCFAYQGSLPISKSILSSRTSIRNLNRIRTMGNKALLSNVNNFSIGSGKTKGSLPIIPLMKDDLSIKYKSQVSSEDVVQLQGESHRIVLTGQTVGSTTSYAYPEGNSENPSISLPNNSNVMIRVNCINTVTGGTSATYPVGHTESMSYYTAFKTLNNVGTQIGTAGGVQEFAIGDSAVRTSLGITLDTTVNQRNRVLFGLIGGQPNTQMVWVLTVDFHIQIIPSLGTPLDTNFALYQDSSNIQLQNRQSLLWN